MAGATLAAAALIAQQVAGKATRDALFLSNFPVTALPPLMIAAALASVLAVLGFSAALARRSPARVVPIALGLGTVLLLAEWGLSLTQPRLAAVAVYLHMALFGATVVSGFWSVVNERFDPYTAKQVMGRIGLGASLGGVAGGFLAWTAAALLPVSAMLAVAAAFNVVCLLALRRIGSGGPPAAAETPVPGDPDVQPLAGLRLLREVPYLRELALIVALGSATETLLDYVLNASAAVALPAGQSLMSFFAAFHTGMALLALILQVTLSRPALQTLGLAGTVALRPAVVAGASVLGLLDPRLWTALLARGTYGILQNSLFRSGYELLFTPLPERRKRPAKAIVDVGFDRLGTTLGGLLILLLVPALGGQAQRGLFALAVLAGLGALAISLRLHRGYVAALEDSLRSGRVRIEVGDVLDSTTLLTLARTGMALDRKALLREIAALRGEGAPEPAAGPSADAVLETVAELRSAQPEAVRQALRRAEAVEPPLIGHLIPLLARQDVFLDVLRVLRRASVRATGQLLDALLDPGQDPVVRRRIPRVLRGSVTQRAVDGLLLGLSDPEFEVRRQCALTLVRLTGREPALQVPRPDVFAAVSRELAAARDDWSHAAEPAGLEEDSTSDQTRTPAERGLAHVFILLALAVEREPLEIAYWALRGEDAGLRGTALEYLDNVLPEELRRALWPHLGARPLRTVRPRQEVVQDLLSASQTSGFSREQLQKSLLRR